MGYWIEEMEGLGSVDLTVQAQARSVDDSDPVGELKFPAFFPWMDTDSVDIRNIFQIDKRYTASRREWNDDGKRLPKDTPKIEDFSMVPLEIEDRVDEYEMQKLREQALGNEAIFRELVGNSIPARVNRMVDAIYRSLEVEAMEAWAKGTITAKNAKDGTTQSVSLGIASGRQQTAGTAWDDGGTNAYNDLMTWLRDGESEMGPIGGVVVRRATLNAIQADAPNPIPGAQSALKPSQRLMEQVVTDELGHEFRFLVFENTVDAYTDGGKATSSTAVWPAQYVAAIPLGGRPVGATYRAPVGRAFELLDGAPGAPIDVRGVSVFNNAENNGKSAVLQAQSNWLALPNEQFVWTIDAGV